jgi:membrane protein DedA with SNARE-associated domain
MVSLLGSLLSSFFGFYLGRSANPYFDTFFSRLDKDFSNSFFQKFSNSAIPISKALPILSEAISFVAGTTSIPLKTFLIYSAVGHLVISVMYAYIGSFSNIIDSGSITVIIIAVIVLAGWLVQFILKKKAVKTDHKKMDEWSFKS